MARRSNVPVQKIVNSVQLYVPQRAYDGGINVADNNKVIADNNVYMAENFDLTTELRLEKRQGYTSTLTKEVQQEFEEDHPELGKITGLLKGRIQAYHSFITIDGEEVEFWGLNGNIYKYPYLFENFPLGVKWDIHDEKDNPITFLIQTNHHYDIQTIEKEVVFATGSGILTYTNMHAIGGGEVEGAYILRKMTPYAPLLVEFLDPKYGQNLLVTNLQERQRLINKSVLSGNGFLGMLINPNIITPSARLVKLSPIVNESRLSPNTRMTTQIATRKVGLADGQFSSLDDVFKRSDRFFVPADYNNYSGQSWETTFTSTDKTIILGTTFNGRAEADLKINLSADETQPALAYTYITDPQDSSKLVHYWAVANGDNSSIYAGSSRLSPNFGKIIDIDGVVTKLYANKVTGFLMGTTDIGGTIKGFALRNKLDDTTRDGLINYSESVPGTGAEKVQNLITSDGAKSIIPRPSSVSPSAWLGVMDYFDGNNVFQIWCGEGVNSFPQRSSAIIGGLSGKTGTIWVAINGVVVYQDTNVIEMYNQWNQYVFHDGKFYFAYRKTSTYKSETHFYSVDVNGLAEQPCGFTDQFKDRPGDFDWDTRYATFLGMHICQDQILLFLREYWDNGTARTIWVRQYKAGQTGFIHQQQFNLGIMGEPEDGTTVMNVAGLPNGNRYLYMPPLPSHEFNFESTYMSTNLIGAGWTSAMRGQGAVGKPFAINKNIDNGYIATGSSGGLGRAYLNDKAEFEDPNAEVLGSYASAPNAGLPFAIANYHKEPYLFLITPAYIQNGAEQPVDQNEPFKFYRTIFEPDHDGIVTENYTIMESTPSSGGHPIFVDLTRAQVPQKLIYFSINTTPVLGVVQNIINNNVIFLQDSALHSVNIDTEVVTPVPGTPPTNWINLWGDVAGNTYTISQDSANNKITFIKIPNYDFTNQNIILEDTGTFTVASINYKGEASWIINNIAKNTADFASIINVPVTTDSTVTSIKDVTNMAHNIDNFVFLVVSSNNISCFAKYEMTGGNIIASDWIDFELGDNPDPIVANKNLADVADFFKNNGPLLINNIRFQTESSSADPSVPDWDLVLKVKYPDYTAPIEFLVVTPGEHDYQSEVLALLFDFDNVEAYARPRSGSTVLSQIKTLSVKVINSPSISQQYFSKYQNLVTPTLQALNESRNVNFAQDCNRIYYKGGYTMYYGVGSGQKRNTGNTIFISDLNRPNYIPQYSTIDMPTSSGEKVQSINSWNVELQNVIFMDNSIHLFKFAGPSEASISQITNEVGLHAPRSVVLADNKLFFVSAKAIYALKAVQYQNQTANLQFVSKPIEGLYTDINGQIPRDAIGYTKESRYYVFMPNVIVGYDPERPNVLLTSNRLLKMWPLSWTGNQPCWYIDQSQFINFSQIVANGDSFLFIPSGNADIMTQDVTAYLDGNLDSYFDDIEAFEENEKKRKEDPTIPPIPMHPHNTVDYFIYNAYLKTKGFNMYPYENHQKNFRQVGLDIGLFGQNVNIIIGTEVDGVPVIDPVERQFFIEHGRVNYQDVKTPNFDANTGTKPGATRETASWVWNQSRWGETKGSFRLLNSYRRGKEISITIEQVSEQPSGFQILSVGVEYRVRNLKRTF